MNTGRIWQTTSTSSSETLRIAEAVGKRLRGGETIELVSDLGGGKTVFVRGLAKGMGSNDTVSSPSFTLTNQYKAAKLTLYHFDFYRLHEAGIMRDEVKELLKSSDSVVAVEWAQIVEDLLPDGRLVVKITPMGNESRTLEFTYPEKLQYLIPGDT